MRFYVIECCYEAPESSSTTLADFSVFIALEGICEDSYCLLCNDVHVAVAQIIVDLSVLELDLE